MRVLILGNTKTAAYKEVAKLVNTKGHTIVKNNLKVPHQNT